jgi:hypothetical protein
MRGRQRRPRVTEGAGEIAWTALLASAVAMFLASAVAVVSAARLIEFGPRVGDIVVFRHGARTPADWEIAAVRSPNATNCVLRPDVMTTGGGSLVIEARATSPRQYRVHWAGPHTSTGSTDCGSTADLTLTRADLQMLINAVGGVGVERRTFAGF